MDLASKSIGTAGVKVMDEEKGIVEAIVGRTGVVDLEGDIFLPGAFGTKDVRASAYNHRSWPVRGGLPPVGRGSIREDGDNVVATVQFFMGTADGRETFELVKEMGDLQEWSFGWLPGTETEGEIPAGVKARRAISKVPVAEVSPVLMGASIGTRTLGVKCDRCAGEEGKGGEGGEKGGAGAKGGDPEPEEKAREEAASLYAQFEGIQREAADLL